MALGLFGLVTGEWRWLVPWALVAITVFVMPPSASVLEQRLRGRSKDTEEAIRASGLPFVFLRNGWYIENYTENLGPVLAHGAVLGSSGEGRVAAATRADFAAAAVAVLTGTGQENRIYELGGDVPFSMADLAEPS